MLHEGRKQLIGEDSLKSYQCEARFFLCSCIRSPLFDQVIEHRGIRESLLINFGAASIQLQATNTGDSSLRAPLHVWRIFAKNKQYDWVN
jgi:hypothetical protein